MRSFRLFIISLFFFCIPLLSAGAAEIEQWPIVAENPWEQVYEGFGPRIESNVYQFHTGIDIPGEIGDPILAVDDGEIVGVYLSSDPTSLYSSNTIVVRHGLQHQFRFQDHAITRYYSVYSHLDTVDAEVVVRKTVNAGDEIATLGMDGATYPHLHFEIRLQTACSLSSSCNRVGFEPHVNPLLLLPYPKTQPASMNVTLHKKDLRVEVTQFSAQQNVNRIEIVGYNKQHSETVNLNKRIHTSNASSHVQITPHDTTSTDTTRTLEVEFSEIIQQKTGCIQVDLYDVHNNRIQSTQQSVDGKPCPATLVRLRNTARLLTLVDHASHHRIDSMPLRKHPTKKQVLETHDFQQDKDPETVVLTKRNEQVRIDIIGIKNNTLKLKSTTFFESKGAVLKKTMLHDNVITLRDKDNAILQHLTVQSDGTTAFSSILLFFDQ